jgi:hypothetical protein
MAKTNTSILFSGKSEYTGKPVQAFITRTSSNTKTGNIPQVTFLPENVKPTDAIKNGQDEDVCGNCPLRPSLFNPKTHEDPCYVNCGFAPNAINRAKNKPLYDYSDLFEVIRIGAWGDGASIEKQALLKIVGLARKVLNYTHAWANKKFNFLKAFSMASVHSIAEKNQANGLGFRTFRTVKPLLFADHLKLFKNGQHTVADLQADEILCPNFTKSIQCKTCKLCCGNQIKARLNIVIPSH